MHVSDALRQRHSVRSFTAQVPGAALVQQLLEDAALAPSGGNMQPWRVAAVTGAPLQALLAEVATTPAQENAALLSYPPDLWEPYRTRRFVNGEDLYRTLGIPREDKPARLQQLAKNAQLFGAPVGIFVYTDERMGYPQWLDVGGFLQSFMLSAAAVGLATCPQGFWRRYSRLVQQHLGLPVGYHLACGIALGYEDSSAAINTLRTPRAAFAEWGKLHGWDD